MENPVFWLAPAFAILFIFRLYPLVEVFRMSLTNMTLLGSETAFVGLESYVNVVTSAAFSTMLYATGVFVISGVILQLVFGMGLALALDYGRRNYLVGTSLTRVGVLMAWVIPGIVIGILWKLMLIGSDYGVINTLLLQLGLDAQAFLTDSTLALISAIVANTWRGTAFSMIMLYAGLQRVPAQLYRAAKVDGAGAIQRFRHVTIPQIKPVIFINIVLITIYTVNAFAMILSLTGGGPGRATEVLSLFMYFKAFEQFQLGEAAAVAVLMLLFNLVMTLIYLRLFIDEEEF
jgi:multiple sugar transport system permease protein